MKYICTGAESCENCKECYHASAHDYMHSNCESLCYDNECAECKPKNLNHELHIDRPTPGYNKEL